MSTASASELARIYQDRFKETRAYRTRVWRTLIDHFFARYVGQGAAVLDLGCGYGDFINQIHCRKKYAMDLNPDARTHLAPDVELFEQDCSTRWPLPDQSLDVVFTSNFFEHLPDKTALGRTLDEAFRCLAPNGRLIALGPNIKYLPGKYWDFWDHHLPLSELSLTEALTNRGFRADDVIARFLPYTMQGQRELPQAFLKIYLRLRPAWKMFGRQFLVVAIKPQQPADRAAKRD